MEPTGHFDDRTVYIHQRCRGTLGNKVDTNTLADTVKRVASLDTPDPKLHLCIPSGRNGDSA